MTILKILLIIAILSAACCAAWYGYTYTKKRKTIQVGETERVYFLHLPKNFDASKTYPVVFVYHGYGDFPKLIELYTGWSAKANKEAFIAVYPQGTNDETERQLSHNGHLCCNPALRNQVDDLSFFEELRKKTIEEHSGNPDAIFVTGFSNGGFMTNRLASEKSELITAAAPVAATTTGRATENRDDFAQLSQPTRPVPILIINGKKDASVLFEGGYNQAETFESKPAKDSFAFWANANNCEGPIKNDRDNKTQSTRFSHPECSKEKTTEFIALDDIAHAWPGGRQFIWANLNNNHLKATDTIWEFFEKFIPPEK
jgi:polyhydroxybutyrate depolymerase